MTGAPRLGKGAAITALLIGGLPGPALGGLGDPSDGPSGAYAADSSADSRPDWAFGDALRFRVDVRPTLLDYELPGHPRLVGVGHVGVVGDAVLDWTLHPRVTVGVGVRGRLPFAFDVGEEAAALPVFYVALKPLASDLATLRFGTLDHDHGHHPALLDQARYGYARPVPDNYNRGILDAAQRTFGHEFFLPAEHGGQLILQTGGLRAEVYLDWQLLETAEHREKFAVGVLAAYTHRWGDASFQYRLVHYGGQRFSQRDPIRAMGLDEKRQPTTLVVTLAPRPVKLDWLEITLPAAFVNGRVNQTPGASESSHWGVEVGLDARLFSLVRLGYRLWLPDGNTAAFVSEDGDPVYAGPRSHRAILGLSQTIGPAEIEGRLDLVFADGADKVQYLTVTTVRFQWEWWLFRSAEAPAAD